MQKYQGFKVAGHTVYWGTECSQRLQYEGGISIALILAFKLRASNVGLVIGLHHYPTPERARVFAPRGPRAR